MRSKFKSFSGNRWIIETSPCLDYESDIAGNLDWFPTSQYETTITLKQGYHAQFEKCRNKKVGNWERDDWLKQHNKICLEYKRKY